MIRRVAYCWAGVLLLFVFYGCGTLQKARYGTAQVVFLGDSITHRWDRTLWAETWEPRGAVNFGVDGDDTEELMWRLEHGRLDGLNPRLVVVAIGVNNLWRGDPPAEKVAAQIAEVVAAVRDGLPTAKVLVVGIFPTQREPGNPLGAKIQQINALTQQRLDDDKTVRFVDFGEKFLQPDGIIAPEIMPDFLHLSPKGYHIYHDNLLPVVDEML